MPLRKCARKPSPPGSGQTSATPASRGCHAQPQPSRRGRKAARKWCGRTLRTRTIFGGRRTLRECSVFSLQYSVLATLWSSFLLLVPAGNQSVLHSNMIEHAGYDGVHHFLDSLRPRVKRGVGGKDDCAGQNQKLEILYVNQIKGSLAWDED